MLKRTCLYGALGATFQRQDRESNFVEMATGGKMLLRCVCGPKRGFSGVYTIETVFFDEKIRGSHK